MTTDRYTFFVEWKDSFSSVVWKFNLFFYLKDETIELYDLLKQRLFLKRTKCEGISKDDLYIGATLRICSRLIYIRDYADSYTRSQVAVFSQKTCGFLKPDLMHKKGEILQLISAKFKIINLKMVQLTKPVANILFEEYEDHSILPLLIQHVTSGPVLAFQILGENSVISLLDLVGPEDPKHITAEGSDSLRARFGSDKIRNGLYVSNSAELAEKDSQIFFGPQESEFNLSPVASMENSYCCIIKPHAVRDGRTGNIMAVIEQAEYEISGVYMTILSTEQAEEFHKVYKYVVTEYQGMVNELCSGPCVALEVKGCFEKNSHSEFRKLVGPFDSEMAKTLRPGTIRARFGQNSVQNAVHVTDLEEDSLYEVNFFFRKITYI